MKSQNSFIIPLSVGGGARLPSLSIGFISSVDPVSILIRGLFAALLGAGFTLAADWLIRTFLPELKETGGVKEDEPAPAEGSRINIVMPDEMPPSAAEGAPSSGLVPGMEGAGPVAGAQENKIAEAGETVHNSKLGDSDSGSSEIPGNLDVLPSLDSLEINMGGSAGSVESGAPDEALDSVTPAPAAAAPSPGEHGDPEDIAKAIKTVIARDQQK